MAGRYMPCAPAEVSKLPGSQVRISVHDLVVLLGVEPSLGGCKPPVFAGTRTVSSCVDEEGIEPIRGFRVKDACAQRLVVTRHFYWRSTPPPTLRSGGNPRIVLHASDSAFVICNRRCPHPESNRTSARTGGGTHLEWGRS